MKKHCRDSGGQRSQDRSSAPNIGPPSPDGKLSEGPRRDISQNVKLTEYLKSLNILKESYK
jgi:hypothetical protein